MAYHQANLHLIMKYFQQWQRHAQHGTALQAVAGATALNHAFEWPIGLEVFFSASEQLFRQLVYRTVQLSSYQLLTSFLPFLDPFLCTSFSHSPSQLLSTDLFPGGFLMAVNENVGFTRGEPSECSPHKKDPVCYHFTLLPVLQSSFLLLWTPEHTSDEGRAWRTSAGYWQIRPDPTICMYNTMYEIVQKWI